MDTRIRDILHGEFVVIIRDQIQELFWSIKTTMMEFFDDIYAIVAKTAIVVASVTVIAIGVGPGWVFSIGTSKIRSPRLSME